MATRMLTGQAPKIPIVDALLTDIAKRIQLSPTAYGVAVDRYEAVCAWLQRENSPVADAFSRLYPQGSFAIGATIASRLKNDEYDIDVIAELNIRADTPPADVFNALFEAMNGEPNSRYHGKVQRRTRCVTVEYADMHLDITPAVLLPQRPERTSVIFHAHEDEPAHMHRHIVANPWGFAQWFEDMTPEVREIVEAMLRKSAEPVPNQEELIEKSKALVALQLLKRWRNKCYDTREGRAPPSVALAYFVATNAAPGRDLFSELQAQAEAMLSTFEAADMRGELVQVVNPACGTDVLTDRWPGDLKTQRVFLSDLKALSADLRDIAVDPSVENCQTVMRRLFGENPTKAVFEDFAVKFADRARSGGLFTRGGTGGIALGTSGLAAAAPREPGREIKRHTDFGGNG